MSNKAADSKYFNTKIEHFYNEKVYYVTLVQRLSL